MSILLVSQAVALTSLPKVIISFALVFAWARWATAVDKDADYFHLNRFRWNTLQLIAGAVGFAALFLMPIFILGFFVAIVCIGAGAGAYINHHNRVTPAGSKWTMDLQGFRNALIARREKRAARNATFRFRKSGLKGIPSPDDPNHEPHIRFEELAEQAFRRNAQRIELVGSETGFTAQIVVDNHSYKQGSMPPAETVAMIDYLKAQCKMDVEERRKKQTGECKIESEEFGDHDLRVMTAGSTRGLNCTIIIDAQAQLDIEYKELGLLDNQRERLQPLLEEIGKVVIVAAPSKQGRSATLYALSQKHDPYVRDIHVFTAAHERDLEGVTLHEVPQDETPAKLQSLLLRSPGVVAIGSVQKPELAKVIAGSGLDPEGPRIYAGLKATDTFGALKVWTKAVGDPETVAKGTAAIISQRLLRKLCTVCRQKYQPDAEAMRKLNLPVDRIQNLYKASGKVMVKNKLEPCPACNGLGYRGLTAAFELMIIDDEARKLIVAGKLDALRTHLRRQKMMWLQEAALAKVVAGQTSISEVTQSLAKEEAAAAAS